MPCKEKLPHLVQMQKDLGDKGLVCLTVSVDDIPENRAKAPGFLQKVGAGGLLNFHLDEPSEVWTERWNVTGPPLVFVFDREGKRAGKFDSEGDHTVKPEEVEKLVRELLKPGG
jgi:hypothetical protein